MKKARITFGKMIRLKNRRVILQRYDEDLSVISIAMVHPTDTMTEALKKNIIEQSVRIVSKGKRSVVMHKIGLSDEAFHALLQLMCRSIPTEAKGAKRKRT